MTARGDALALGEPSRRSPWRAALAAFSIALVALVVLVAAFFMTYARLHDGRIVPGVRVAGVAVGGLDPAGAETALRGALPPVARGALTVTVGEHSLVIPYSELRRDYRIGDALAAAFAVGRDGAPPELAREQVQSLLRGVDVPLPVAWDRATLDARIASFLASVAAPPVDARITLRDGRYAVEPSSVGASVDVAAVQREAAAAVDAAGFADATVRLTPETLEPTYTTDEADAAATAANAMTAHPVSLSDGTKTETLPLATVRGWVQVRRTAAGDFSVTLDEPTILAAVERAAQRLGTPAKDAAFAFGAGRSIVAVPAADGLAVDVPATVVRVSEALEGRSPDDAAPAVDAVMRAVEPGFTTAEAEAAAPRVRRVSAWSTGYVVSRSNFFGKNITTPTSVIDGTVVAPGEVFDFWQVVGEVSEETGYGAGGAIINGQTEPTGALAGGICSCSTTIFNAALRAGLEMGSRQNHYYYISRYPMGLDATVWKSSSGAEQTMSFRNDTEYPVLIRGINRPGVVRFELWTIPTGRTVEFSRPRIEDRTTARDTIRYTDDLAPGASERVEYPANGFKVWVTRTVRDASGTVIHEETYYSRYSRVDGVTLVGRRPGDPPDGTVVVVG